MQKFEDGGVPASSTFRIVSVPVFEMVSNLGPAWMVVSCPSLRAHELPMGCREVKVPEMGKRMAYYLCDWDPGGGSGLLDRGREDHEENDARLACAVSTERRSDG